MTRLPAPGGDNNIWGTMLNDFLLVEHTETGALRKAGQISQATDTANNALAVANARYLMPNGGIPESDLQAAVQTKLNTVASGGVASVNGHSGVVSLVPSDLGLGNVDNTSDTNKPLSAAAIAALAGKVNIESFDGSGAAMKLIALSDGSVRAVPASLTPLPAPANFTADIHLSFVRLSWQPVPSAAMYRVYKNDNLFATRTNESYPDNAIAAGNSYSYKVQAVDQYGVWGAVSQTITANIDISLNSNPVLAAITIWPLDPAPTDIVYVHVNANDIDAQVLATTLNTSIGSLTPTFDPTTWKWQAA